MLQFIEQANKHFLNMIFTTEISETESNVLDTNVYKAEEIDWSTMMYPHI